MAEVLLQRSRSSSVALVFGQMIARWPTASALAAARVNDIHAVLRPLGLTSRAKRIQALAERIADLGYVPQDEASLKVLPGVGVYSAAATAAALGKQSSPLVDSVSQRVFQRFFSSANGESDLELAERAYANAPKGRWHELNWAVLDLASAVCLPKNPRCSICHLSVGCSFAQNKPKSA